MWKGTSRYLKIVFISILILFLILFNSCYQLIFILGVGFLHCIIMLLLFGALFFMTVVGFKKIERKYLKGYKALTRLEIVAISTYSLCWFGHEWRRNLGDVDSVFSIYFLAFFLPAFIIIKRKIDPVNDEKESIHTLRDNNLVNIFNRSSTFSECPICGKRYSQCYNYKCECGFDFSKGISEIIKNSYWS